MVTWCFYIKKKLCDFYSLLCQQCKKYSYIDFTIMTTMPLFDKCHVCKHENLASTKQLWNFYVAYVVYSKEPLWDFCSQQYQQCKKHRHQGFTIITTMHLFDECHVYAWKTWHLSNKCETLMSNNNKTWCYYACI